MTDPGVYVWEAHAVTVGIVGGGVTWLAALAHRLVEQRRRNRHTTH